jgi:uncharacterized Zn finger protein (UPF0148 family)
MKNSIFIAVFALALFSSCKDTSKNESAEMSDNPKVENQAEIQRKQDSIEAVREENRKLDSIQQIKAHGHAH